MVGDQPAAVQPRYTQPPARVVSDDEIEAIHLASLEVLKRTGIDILHADARERLAAAGARVDGDRVRFAISVDAARRSGLRISSQLLSLAQIHGSLETSSDPPP